MTTTLHTTPAETTAPTATIQAYFQPQAWINDYAVDVDGATHFDVTEQVLDLAATHGWTWVSENVTDNSDLSDNLWYGSPDCEHAEHAGPFYVNVEDAIDGYLDAFTDVYGRSMTPEDIQERLTAIRATKSATAA